MRKFYILWASIRPNFISSNSKRWIDRCQNKENLYFKIAMATEEQKKEVESFNIPNCDVIAVTEKPGYNYAITSLTLNLEVNDEDVLILLSDDFSCPENWDEFLNKKFENYEDAVFLDDGYQDKNAKVGCLCITLACMTFKCLKKINKVVFSPYYFHFFSDTEAFQNLNQLGLLKDNRDTDNMLFKHEHHIFGMRQQDEADRKASEKFNFDKEIFNQRLKMTAKERLDDIISKECTDSIKNDFILKLANNIKYEVKLLSNKEELVKLYQLTKEVCENNLKGDIAEVGVYEGGTAKILATAKNTDKKLYLMDSFEGVNEVNELDSEYFTIGQYKSDIEKVKEYLKEFKNIKILKGVFPKETSKYIKNKRFCLVNIDVDTYQSTLDCLNYFYNNMVKNGYIVIHDYKVLDNIKKAVDEFIVDKKIDKNKTEINLTQIIIKI